MTNKNKQLFHSLNVTKDAKATAAAEDNTLSDLMANPEYLRHSSSVINDALKDGFDVLQLPNGDIVATGTKTIVNTFTWDKAKKKLVKARTSTDKPAREKKPAKDKAKAKEATQ